MRCAIQLVFDESIQSKLNNVRKLLNDNGVHDEAVELNHISIADIEIEESQIHQVKKILLNFSQTHKSIKLTLNSAGSFMSKENVLFLTPTMTQELINYNDEIINELQEANIKCGKYYTKNNWQPHCTIAIRLNDEELFKGFKIVKCLNILPLEVVVDKIDLLCYEPKPYKEIVSYNFN